MCDCLGGEGVVILRGDPTTGSMAKSWLYITYNMYKVAIEYWMCHLYQLKQYYVMKKCKATILYLNVSILLYL